MVYFPAEIHNRIASYLSDADLCNYRLAGRMLADIGAEKLFQTLTFHASRDSVDRLKLFSENNRMSRGLQTLVWDTNMWNLYLQSAYEDQGLPQIQGPYSTGGTSRFQEFLEYLTEFHRPIKDRILFRGPPSSSTDRWFRPMIASLNPDYLGQQYEEYERRVADENEVLDNQLKRPNFSRILDRFVNLDKIYIVNGDFEFRNGKLSKKHFRCGPPQLSDLFSRGERLHSRENKRPGQAAGVSAFWTVLVAAGKRVRKLRLDALDWKAFVEPIDDPESREDPNHPLTKLYKAFNFFAQCAETEDRSRYLVEPINPTLLGPCEHLTSLKLTITTWDEDDTYPVFDYAQYKYSFRGTLQNFLRQLPKLQSLSLSPERLDEPSIRLKDVIPQDFVWPSLRKLSLSYFRLDGPDFIAMLGRHQKTLKDLRLSDMDMPTIKCSELDMDTIDCDQYGNVNCFDWRYVSYKIQSTLNLEKAKFGGLLGTCSVYSKGWNMEGGLGDALAAYAVNGGDLPLTAENVLPARYFHLSLAKESGPRRPAIPRLPLLRRRVIDGRIVVRME